MEAAGSAGAFGKLSPGAPGDPVEFGPYLLFGLIARGGMAEVYRARRADGRGGPHDAVGAGRGMLAIKVMRPQLARETRFVEMFIREGRLAVMLECASIVRTFDVGEVGGRYFIAMEYIGGKDLTQVLRRCQETGQRLPVPHAIAIAAAICDGLSFAHTLGDPEGRPLNIVNRDVSPSNVRLAYDGRVKLLDFGIAQAMLKFTSEIGILKGKFSYMSPEQIRGLPVDARTDVFSTGIILHEMLTTEKLFRGDTEFALMEKVRKAEVLPPSKFNRRVSAELDRICLKALARDLDERYQSAGDLREDLMTLLAGYRFQPRELEEFMRSLFRQDVAREEEELKGCTLELRPPAPQEVGFEISDGQVVVIESTGTDHGSTAHGAHAAQTALPVSSGPVPAARSGVHPGSPSSSSRGDGGAPLHAPTPASVAPTLEMRIPVTDGEPGHDPTGPNVPPGPNVPDGAGGGGLWSRIKKSLSR